MSQTTTKTKTPPQKKMSPDFFFFACRSKYGPNFAIRGELKHFCPPRVRTSWRFHEKKTHTVQKCNLNGTFAKIIELQTNGREGVPFPAAFSSRPPTGRTRPYLASNPVLSSRFAGRNPVGDDVGNRPMSEKFN